MSTDSGHVLIARPHDLYADGYIVGYGGGEATGGFWTIATG